MDDWLSRRRFLELSATTYTAGSAVSAVHHASKEGDSKQASPRLRSAGASQLRSQDSNTAPVDVRGAVYVPTRAFNRFQMWREYDPDVIERDLGYAARLNLNSIRTWLSYEYWLEDREAHGEKLEHFLETADAHGLRVLLGLFDSIGEEPTLDNLLGSDLHAGVQTYSPSTRTMRNPSLWDNPRDFILWFMRRYSDDSRLLAIELSNEPGWRPERKRFVKAMSELFTLHRGSIPLTIGSTSLTNNTDYLEWGMDVLQFHYNFAQSPSHFRRALRQAKHIQSKYEAPVWLSEWQRIRPGEGFFADLDGEARFPDYSSLARLLQTTNIGNFFWSLMLRPASELHFRHQGMVNGLFHEDGAVWSLDDARAITAMSGDSSFEGTERKEYPDWMAGLLPSRYPRSEPYPR
ncbi:glycoside hydrolase [Haladaptatus sp. DFWS20]|uniref:glycoside hydrolase n=1 Tax=Haladaptatus sp. DFWS20 TaxID=3403467 RepID=UPI003EBF9CC4